MLSTSHNLHVSGTVITPDHPDYDHTRRAWNLTTNQYPALILIAANVQDVVAGVNYARDSGLGVSIQSTGHGIQQEANDALLIITSQLTGVQVDPQARTARVEAGVLWGQVVEQSAPHGLAPLLGSSPHVGVMGYTLAGGIGWLARKYGLAADSVRWIDVVTPDGELRRTSATENSDLFWGLRGGGGNFGVVTAMEIDLYPVASLYGGNIAYPGEAVADVLRFFRDWTKNAPDELTSSVQVIKFPSLPFVPEPMRGKVQVVIRAAYIGDPAEGARLIQQWLDWRTPLTNEFHELPFAEIATVSNDPVNPTPGYGSNELLRELSDGLIDVIVRQMTDAASPLFVTELRHAGGAIARADANANAVSHRDAEFFMNMAGMAPTPEALKAVKGAIHDYKEALRPYRHGGVYLNFMKGAEAAERAGDGYGKSVLARLVALKQQYDPANLFRYSYQLVG